MDLTNYEKIVTTNEKQVRIVAGPGTGKTTTLKNRIKHLLENGEDPKSILLLTFTRMAAKDIQTELFSTGLQRVAQIKTGTLHSFCFELLKNANFFNSIGRTPRILFDFEIDFLLEDLSLTAPFKCTKKGRERLLRSLEAGWAREQQDTPGWPDTEEEKEFLRICTDWLLFHQSLLIGELITLSVKYLRDNPKAQEINIYKHILIDEYQDLNKAEQHFLSLLTRNSNVMVVGDEDQSIYEQLKFARPEGILEYHKAHDNVTDHRLNLCFRCPPKIVIMANELIQHNQNRSDHILLPKEDNPDGEIFIHQFEDINDELNSIARLIELKITSGEFKKKDIIVLTPIKELGYQLKELLMNKELTSRAFFSNEYTDGNPKKLV